MLCSHLLNYIYCLSLASSTKTTASSTTQLEEVKPPSALVNVEAKPVEDVDATNQSSVTSGGKDQQVVASNCGDDEVLSETNQINDSSNTFTSSYSSV